MAERTSERVALVTGANRGLGLETARQLFARGHRVILTSRSGGPDLARNIAGRAEGDASGGGGRPAGAEHRRLDVTDEASIAALAAGLERDGVELDVLVNNAGIAMEGFDLDVVRSTLAVNFTGAMRVTDGLVPLVRDGGNVVMVSSGVGELSGIAQAVRSRFAAPGLTRDELVLLMDEFARAVERGDHRAAGWPSSAYRVSKVGLNALTRILARELAGRSIRVNAVCPGWVRTDMGGASATRGVAKGAASIVWAALLDADGPTGGFFRDGSPIPW